MKKVIYCVVIGFALIAAASLNAGTDTSPAKQPQPAAASQPPSKAPAAAPSMMDLARVKKGEGPEHAFIRQLMEDPSIVDGEDEREHYTGNPEDEKALRAWAGWEAHRLALRIGYVDWKFGAEVRTLKVGTAYLLKRGSNSKLTVAVFAPQEGGEKTPTLAKTHTLAPTTQAKFLAMPGADGKIPALPSYEYLYTGANADA